MRSLRNLGPVGRGVVGFVVAALAFLAQIAFEGSSIWLRMLVSLVTLIITLGVLSFLFNLVVSRKA
jgi:hypothetical protein